MAEKILYKYRPIDSYTIKLLENNEFHFSFPFEFNDPFDCDASIEFGGEKEEITKWLKSYGTDKNQIDSMIQFLEITNFNMFQMNTLLDLILSASTKGTFPIFCLAEEKDNILMWSHYSDKHKGICLGFKILQNENELSLEMDEKVNNIEPHNRAILFKVGYNENYPKPYNPIKDDSLVLFEFFKTKSKLWEYEKEYRAHIIYEYFKKQEFKFNKNILREVILGVQTSNENMKLIINCIKENYIKAGIEVKVFKAVKIKSKYKVGFKQITI